MLIIFDLDDTLINTFLTIIPYKIKKALKLIYKKKILKGNFHKDFKYILTCTKKVENTIDIFKFFLEEKNKIKDLNILNLLNFELYKKKLPSYLKIYPFDGVNDILKKLAKKNILCLVSKGNKRYQRYKAKKSGIDLSLFSKIDFVRYDKKKIYKNIFLKYNVSADKVIVCGDKIEADLKPAKELGFKTILINQGRNKNDVRNNKYVDFFINNLKQINTLI